MYQSTEMGSDAIASNFNVSPTCVLRILKRNNIPIKGKLKNGKREIKELSDSGLSSKEIANKFDVHYTYIARILKDIKSGKIDLDKLDKENEEKENKIKEKQAELEIKQREKEIKKQEFEKRVIDLYQDGKRSNTIADMLGTNQTTIINILKNNNIERIGRLSKNDKQEIIKLYQEGISPKEIGEKFGIYNNSVTRILKKAGIERNQAPRKITADIENIIIEKYKNKISSPKIAEELNISDFTVRRVLKKYDIEINRNNVEISYETHDGKPKLSEEEIKEICRLYKEENTSYSKLAQQFNVSKPTIMDKIKKYGMKNE